MEAVAQRRPVGILREIILVKGEGGVEPGAGGKQAGM